MKSKYDFYITGAIIFGLSSGVISMLARWITGYPLLIYPESFMKFGVIGGVGFFLSFGVSLFIFGYIGFAIRKRYPYLQTLNDLYESRLTNKGFSFLSFITFILGMASLFFQTIAIILLLSFIDAPLIISLAILFVYCFLIVGLGGMRLINYIDNLSITVIFLGLIMVPLYILLSNGVFPIYNGVRLYHPYLLFLKNNDAYLFIIIGFIISFSKLLVDLSTWQRLSMIKIKNIKKTFLITSLISSSVPITLSIILLITIHNQSFGNSNAIFFELLYKLNSPLIATMFFLLCFFVISTTITSELHALTVHTIDFFNRKKHSFINQLRYSSTIISSLIFLMVILLSLFFSQSISVLTWLFIVSHVYVSVTLVILIMIFSKKKIPKLLPYIPVLGILSSFFLPGKLPMIHSILVTFFLCSFTSILLYYINNLKVQFDNR